MLPSPSASLPPSPPPLQSSPARWQSRANLSLKVQSKSVRRRESLSGASASGIPLRGRPGAALLSSPLLRQSRCCLSRSLLKPRSGRRLAVQKSRRERERERGPGRERQGTGEKANEAEVRNVGGERAAKSDGRVGSGGDGRKWQQQQVRRRRGRRVDT